MNDRFVCHFDSMGLLKSESGEDSDVMRMYGWASTGAKDADGEYVLQKGLDLSEVVPHGWVNWNHSATDIIGIPRVAEIRERVEDGKSFGKCVYTEFDLLKNNPIAKKVWDLSKSLEDTDRSLGMSLEGQKILQKGSSVIKAKVLNIAVAPLPKNKETTVRALVKALGANDAEALEAFSLESSQESAVLQRIEGTIESFIKALDSQTEKIQANATEIVPPLGDLIALGDSYTDRLPKLDPALQKIGYALVHQAQKRQGQLTKAEAGLLTFVMSDKSLLECFELFGL